MAYRTKRDGPRTGLMSRASWARLDRAVETITRREARDACDEGRREAEALREIGRLARDADNALGWGRPDDYRAAHHRMVEIQDDFYSTFGRAPGGRDNE